MNEWPFEGLKKNHYGVILADPPWLFEIWGEAKGASRDPKYPCASVADLAKFPVADLAADDCVLLMWCTWPLLKDGLKLIEDWGFTYKTCGFAWIKAWVNQPNMFRDDADTQVGLGYWTRANSEFCLLATRGKPKRLHADVRQGIIEPRREHSRKPDCVHERIQRLVSGPYCELFARQHRVGWDVWGNDTHKFVDLSEHHQHNPKSESLTLPTKGNTMNIVQRVENLSHKIGVDIITLWDKFEDFVEKEFESKKTENAEPIQKEVDAPAPPAGEDTSSAGAEAPAASPTPASPTDEKAA